MTDELKKKVAASIKLLQSISSAHQNEEIELAYSGGKDSDVILQLAKEAGIKFRPIYRNTTIDPRGTISHCKANGVEIRQPKQPFFKLVEEKGLPTRFTRFCCGYLKEYKILDTCILGVRRAESSKRAKLYKEPTACRYYRNKKDHVEQVFPILEWSNDDVREFILDRGLQLAPCYYDADGTLHTERRLGCIGCPLASHTKRLADLKQNPCIVRAYIRALRKFRATHDTPATRRFRNEYEQIVRDFFFDEQEEYEQVVGGGLFGEDARMDCKKVLEDYFNIKL